MALFGKERDGGDRTYGGGVVGGDAGEGRLREAAMAERNANQVSSGQSPGGVATDAFLGKGTKITGKLVFEGTGRIDGQVDGEIAAHDVLTISDGAVVNAKIVGTTIVIDGAVTGDVSARERLELRPSARVNGNVTTPTLVVQEGAVLHGQCAMTGGEARAGREKPDVTTRALDQARDAAMQIAAALPMQR